MRVILKLFKSLTLVFMALVIVMFAINWSDQEPSPAAVEMESLLEEGSHIPDEDNGFVFAMGFQAPRGDDPVRSGSECIAKLNAAVKKQNINFDTDLECWDQPSSECDETIITHAFNACGLPMRGEECEKALREKKQAITQFLESESWLLDRYLELLKRDQWHSTTEYSIFMPMPYYGEVGKVQKMLLLKAWQLSGQGKSVEVQSLLNQDAKFWRAIMSSSHLLLDKMVAAGFLARHFAFSNLVLRRLQQMDVQVLVPDAWLVPFERDELSLKRTMAGELAFFTNILLETKIYRTVSMDGSDTSSPKQISVIDKWLVDINSHFLLPQATQNAQAEHLLKLARMLDASPRQLPQALKQVDAYVEELASDSNLLTPYNPIGNVLVRVAVPAYSGYAEKIYDLEGVRRAALVTVQLRKKGIEVNQVESELSQSDITNPYDEKPFTWNAETKSIVFKGLGTGERSTHSFLY